MCDPTVKAEYWLDDHEPFTLGKTFDLFVYGWMGERDDGLGDFVRVQVAKGLAAALSEATARADAAERKLDLALLVIMEERAERMFLERLDRGEWTCSCNGRNEGLRGDKSHPVTRDACPVCGDRRP